MILNWKTPSGLIVDDYEETKLKDKYIDFEPYDATIEIISGELPQGITLEKVHNGRYELVGVLPIVNGETSYYFTLRISLEDENLDRYFEIKIKNKKTEWDDNLSDSFTYAESAYVSEQLTLKNATNKETFIKLSGELPKGLSLNNRGLIYGIPNKVESNSTYECVIGVKQDNQIILTKKFAITIVQLSSLQKPVWITESGIIGNLNYQSRSDISVKAYDPNNLKITYILGNKGYLPDGLTLNSSTGTIEGRLDTLYDKEWIFDIIASNGEYEESRDFTIVTNKLLDVNNIIWESETNLGSYKIGENVLIDLKTKSNYPVTYSLIESNLPKGLKLSSNGEITGNIQYQNLNIYSFIIEAYNGYTTITKTFEIEVKSGLGKNSVKSYLYINHEYDNEYNTLIGTFDRNTAYESSNEIYKINNYPEIDICTLNCFDKTLLKHMLNFNKTLNIIWDKTVRKNYIQDEEIKYSVYYKQMHEEISKGNTITIDGNKVYIEPSAHSPTGYINEYTKEPIEITSKIYTEVQEGKQFIELNNKKIYILILNNTQYYEVESKKLVDLTSKIYSEKYVDNNEQKIRLYILNDMNKIEVMQCEDGMLADINTQKYLGLSEYDVTIQRDKPHTRRYIIDDNEESLSLASTSEIRNIMNEKIIVKKNNNDHVLYDMGSQEIVSENNEYPEYMVYWDEERQTYYVEYKGEKKYVDVYAIREDDPTQTPQPVYASYKREGWIAEIDGGIASTDSFEDIYDNGNASSTEFKYIIDGNYNKLILVPVRVYNEYLNTDVDYKNYFIYEKGTMNLQENIIFTLSWKNDCKFIIIDGVVHHIASINKPWMFIPVMNENIGFGNTIVLPYVSDENVMYDNNNIPYIRFFDEEKESLPVWKTRTINEWAPNTSYIVNDKFEYNGIYYNVIKNYISSGIFEETNLRKMTENEIEYYNKPYYYPTLDVFYSKPNTNLYTLSNLNKKEEQGGYWTDRKFIFYELHFKSLYNEDIDNFAITFYNYKDKRTPEFQLI